LLLDALHLALADDNAKLRKRYPDVFERVDALKSEPDWHPNTRNAPPVPAEPPKWLRVKLGIETDHERAARRDRSARRSREWRRARATRPV